MFSSYFNKYVVIREKSAIDFNHKNFVHLRMHEHKNTNSINATVIFFYKNSPFYYFYKNFFFLFSQKVVQIQEIPCTGRNVLEFFCVPLYTEFLSYIHKRFQVASIHEMQM